MGNRGDSPKETGIHNLVYIKMKSCPIIHMSTLDDHKSSFPDRTTHRLVSNLPKCVVITAFTKMED